MNSTNTSNQVDNIIGPISLRHWKTMRMLHYSIKQMKAANDNDLFDTIDKESELYYSLLRDAVWGQPVRAAA